MSTWLIGSKTYQLTQHSKSNLIHAKNVAAGWRTRIQICRRKAANLCKQGKSVLHRQPPLFKEHSNTTGDFNN
jgi:hypothetical protein